MKYPVAIPKRLEAVLPWLGLASLLVAVGVCLLELYLAWRFGQLQQTWPKNGWVDDGQAYRAAAPFAIGGWLALLGGLTGVVLGAADYWRRNRFERPALIGFFLSGFTMPVAVFYVLGTLAMRRW